MSNIRHKKGQSLVEVVVALSILTIVLTATITLIVNVVNLTLASRMRTQAVAVAQRAITDGIVQISGGCNLGSVSYTDPDPSDGIGVTLVLDPPSAHASEGLDTASWISPTPGKFNDDNFSVLEATVTWQDKGADVNTTYTVKQIVSK